MAPEANGSGQAPQPLPRRLVSIGLPLASLTLVLIFLLVLFLEEPEGKMAEVLPDGTVQLIDVT